MCRLSLMDSGIDIISKMSEGNPGSIQAIIEILKEHDAIDPQAFMGGVGAIMMLDTWEIYGTDIYVLWADKCRRDTRKMLMLMRATQLGLYPQSDLQALASDQTSELLLDDKVVVELDVKVCEQLSGFARPKVVEETKDGN